MKGRRPAVLFAALALASLARAGDVSSDIPAPQAGVSTLSLPVLPLQAAGVPGAAVLPASAVSAIPSAAAPPQALPMSLLNPAAPQPALFVSAPVASPDLFIAPAAPRTAQERAVAHAQAEARGLLGGLRQAQDLDESAPGADLYSKANWASALVPDRDYAERLSLAASLLVRADRPRSPEEAASRQAQDRLAATMKSKDPAVYSHLARVGLLSGLLAWKLGLPMDTAIRVMRAGRLHDIGKREEKILALVNKRGALTAAERAVVEEHAAAGAAIIAREPGISAEDRALAQSVALLHHETMNGTGYPLASRSEEIPFEARLVHLADFFDALLENRPYRRGLTVKEARRILASRRAEFDPAVWAAFEALFDAPPSSGPLPRD